jgi:hypothetical protein
MTSPVCIWRFLDGKAGHRNQVLGLTDALSDLCSTDCYDVDVTRGLAGWRSLMPGRLNPLTALPQPDLLIGAGHATHVPLLASRYRFGGRSIVLMTPSLPMRWFDACLVPRADERSRLPETALVTEGVLNRIRPAARWNPRRGLLLIGGPSAHFDWQPAHVLDQIEAVISGTPGVTWSATTSRRTPDSFVEAWLQRDIPAELTPVEDTTADWLPRQLQECGVVWVTADSVSMVYEAMTAGAAVGLLQLPEAKSTRVTRGMAALCDRDLVTCFDDWRQGDTLPRPRIVLRESERCARELLARYFPDRMACVPDVCVHRRRAA